MHLQALNADRVAADAIEQATRVIVAGARAAGHTWQEIGEVLSISRQAAHQRFGERRPDATTTDDAVILARAREIFEQAGALEWDRVSADWNQAMHDGLGVERLSEAWAQIISTAGPFEAVRAGVITRRGPYRIVDVPLSFRFGPMKGRVVFTLESEVSGLFVLLPDAP